MIALEAFLSAATYIALALLLGALATAGLVLPPGENPLRRKLLSAALILLPAFLLAAALGLVLQGAKLQGGGWPALEILGRYLTRTQSGKIWLWRELYAAALLLLLLAFREGANPARVAGWLFALALPLVASRSLMSHAAAVRDNALLAVAADAAHLVATALWAGGLPALFWALRDSRRRRPPLAWAAETVARFSRLALASVALLVTTGLYQSWVELQSWSALFATAYGRVLLLKLALFLPMLALGAVNLFSTKPNLAKAESENPLFERRARRRIGAESALGVL
ncbi:MAG TPA: CopD family protein, partial [Candidatus Binatia bacterium]